MNALVVGGSSGIGLSIVLSLEKRDDVSYVYVIDKNFFPSSYSSAKIKFFQFDLSNFDDFSVFDEIGDIQCLYITAGFGHLMTFEELGIEYIENSFAVNTLAPIKIIKYYYDKLLCVDDFYCAVMVSIAGRLSSPLFSIYSATKAALSKFIEAVNVELEMKGSNNRILEVSPGSLKGTSFSGGVTDPSLNADLAKEIITRSQHRNTLFIPQFDEIFRNVIERYNSDPHKFGVESYQYKMGRMNKG